MFFILLHVAMGYPQAWGANHCGELLAGNTLSGMGGLQKDSAIALSWSNTSLPCQFEIHIGNVLTGMGAFATTTKGTLGSLNSNCPQFSYFDSVSSEDVFLYIGTGESVDIDIAWAASSSGGGATVYYQRLSLPATASPPPLPPPRVPLGMPDSPSPTCTAAHSSFPPTPFSLFTFGLVVSSS